MSQTYASRPRFAQPPKCIQLKKTLSFEANKKTCKIFTEGWKSVRNVAAFSIRRSRGKKPYTWRNSGIREAKFLPSNPPLILRRTIRKTNKQTPKINKRKSRRAVKLAHFYCFAALVIYRFESQESGADGRNIWQENAIFGGAFMNPWGGPWWRKSRPYIKGWLFRSLCKRAPVFRGTRWRKMAPRYYGMTRASVRRSIILIDRFFGARFVFFICANTLCSFSSVHRPLCSRHIYLNRKKRAFSYRAVTEWRTSYFRLLYDGIKRSRPD